MKKIKGLSILLTCVLCVTMLVACESEPAGTESTPAPSEGTTTTAASSATEKTEGSTTATTTAATTTTAKTTTATTTATTTTTTTTTEEVIVTSVVTTTTTKRTTKAITTQSTQSTTQVTLPTQPGEEEEPFEGKSFEIDGRLIDWCVQGETLYALFVDRNVYVAFDAATGDVLKQSNLPGRPAEIQMVGEELWISFPEAKCIQVYDPDSFALKTTIRLPKVVSSFALVGEYLFFTEDAQHVEGFRYNTKTEELITLTREDGGYLSFYQADVVANPEENLVYIAESGTSGGKVYAYDVTTLQIKSKFVLNDYGYNNHCRRSFLVDGNLYWGEFCLLGSDISCMEYQYSNNGGGMLWVDDNAVVTRNAIFDRKTGDMVAKLEFPIDAVAFTPAGNMMLWDGYNNVLYLFYATE